MSLLLNIVLEHVEKRFKGKTIFEDLNFQVDKGQTIGILGANGVGKSVLFKLICWLERPNQGRVFVNNVEVGREEDFPRDVGILINEPAFIPIYSGIKNLMLLAEINNTVDEKTVKSYMKSVGLDPENQTKVQNSQYIFHRFKRLFFGWNNNGACRIYIIRTIVAKFWI